MDLNEINFSKDDKLLFVTSEFSHICPLCHFPFGGLFRIQSITLSGEKSCGHWVWGDCLKKQADPRGGESYESFWLYIFRGKPLEKI